jgi:predicted GTPase
MDTYVSLHFSVERMVSNKIRERFGFEGSPIVIKTRGRRKSTKE